MIEELNKIKYKIDTLNKTYEANQLRANVLNTQLTEATNYVLNYRDKFGEIPSEEQLDEYFFLFRNNNDDNLFNNKLHLMGNYKKTLKSLRNNKPLFKSYNDFIMHVFNKK